MAAKLTGMMFWTDAWMTSRARLLMTVEERGVYLETLFAAWPLGACLPNDPQQIRLITLISEDVWNRCWPKVKLFWEDRGDVLINPKQLEVYLKAASISEVNSNRGREAAIARWEKERARGNAPRNAPSTTPRNAQSNARAMPSVSVSESNKPPNRTSAVNHEIPRAEIYLSRAELPQPPDTSKLPPGCEKHLSKPACMRGVCVMPKLHDEFVRKLGGDPKRAQRLVMAFYGDVINALPSDHVIGETNWDFWRREFAGRFEKPRGPVPNYRSAEQVAADAARDRAIVEADPVTEEHMAEYRRKIAEMRQKGILSPASELLSTGKPS
jgi:uncharacterized protein YdaU (DUF1376 family)